MDAPNQANEIKKIAKGAGVSLIGKIVGKFLWFSCQVIIARALGVELFGLYILGLSTLKITELLSRFGLHSGAMRFVSIYRRDNPEKVKGILFTAFIVTFINGLLIGSIIYFSAEFISEVIFKKPALQTILKMFALCNPFMATMVVFAKVSRGFHTVNYDVLTIDIIRPTANILFVLLLSLSGLDIFKVVYAYIISNVIALVAGGVFIVRLFPGIMEKTLRPVYETKQLLSYSAPLLLSSILVFLLSWTDTLMLGVLGTATDVGIYRATVQVTIFLGVILSSFNTIYAPVIAEMFVLGKIKRMEKLFKTITRWVFLVTLPILAILLFSAKEIISIFGSGYIEKGTHVLIVLAVARFIGCVTGPTGITLSMTGKQNIEMANSLFLIVLNVILNMIMIPLYGPLGAALATGISIVVINILRLVEIYHLYRIHPYNIGYIKGLISLFFTVTVLFLVGQDHMLNCFYITKFIINSLFICVVFTMILFFLGFEEEDKLVVNMLQKKIRQAIS